MQNFDNQAPLLRNHLNLEALTRSAPTPPGLLPLEDRFRKTVPLGGTFANPILPAPSADPWVIHHDGFYYYCESRQHGAVFVRKASSFINFSQVAPAMVWNAPAFGANSKSIWAPELHHIQGKWYIYYAADNGLNENHRMWVLESDNPMGPYICRGALETSGWAIDGTVLQHHNGSLYFLWSGWPGKENGRQNLYVAPMRNPWTLSGSRVLLAQPENSWECVDMPICEGPQILKNNGRTFLVYSASGSWTVDYCLGLMELTGSDPLNTTHWQKKGCVFQKSAQVWGIGHCSFVKSPDATEDWIVYHAKSKRKKGWNDRSVRAQKFGWTAEGLPHFGEPVPAGISMPAPSSLIVRDIGI